MTWATWTTEPHSGADPETFRGGAGFERLAPPLSVSLLPCPPGANWPVPPRGRSSQTRTPTRRPGPHNLRQIGPPATSPARLTPAVPIPSPTGAERGQPTPGYNQPTRSLRSSLAVGTAWKKLVTAPCRRSVLEGEYETDLLEPRQTTALHTPSPQGLMGDRLYHAGRSAGRLSTRCRTPAAGRRST